MKCRECWNHGAGKVCRCCKGLNVLGGLINGRLNLLGVLQSLVSSDSKNSETSLCTFVEVLWRTQADSDDSYLPWTCMGDMQVYNYGGIRSGEKATITDNWKRVLHRFRNRKRMCGPIGIRFRIWNGICGGYTGTDAGGANVGRYRSLESFILVLSN